MGKPDITNAQRAERVRAGSIDVKRTAQFRKRFPPAAKRHLFIRDNILFEQRDTPVNPDKKSIAGVKRWAVEQAACEAWFHKLYGCKICLIVCPLNAKSTCKENFKATTRGIRSAKYAQGLLSLIELRTKMRYGELDYVAQGNPAIAPDVGIEDDEDQAE